MPTIAVLAATILVLFGISLAASVVVPLVLALALTIAFQPIGVRVARRGLPPIITSLITIVAVLALVGIASLVVVMAATDLAESVPRYKAALATWRGDAVAWSRSRELDALAAALRSIDPEAYLSSMAARSAVTLGDTLATVALVVLLTVFVQLESHTFPARLRNILGSARRSRESIDRTIEGVAEIQRYMIMKMLASATKGVLVGLVAWAIGLEQPLLWATIIFTFNFIPVLGPLAAAAPAVLAAALSLGIPTALAFGAVLLGINIALGSIVEPRLLGRVIGLSPLVIILSITLWGLVLGPVGALLGVPLTMVAKLMLEESEDFAWISRLLEYRSFPAKAFLAAAAAAAPE